MKTTESTPVTRGPVTIARGRATPIAGVLVCGLLAMMAAGCSSTGTSVGDAAATASLTATPAVAQSKPVTFAPVIGAPANVAARMNELLVAQAGQKSLPVVPPKDAEYTVRGYLVAATDPKGTKLSYIWDVSDKANKRKRFQDDLLIEGKKGGDPWAVVDEGAMQRVAAKAVEDITGWLPKGENTSAAVASAPAAPAPVQVASLSNDTPLSIQTSQPARAAPETQAEPAAAKPAVTLAAAPAGPSAVAVVPAVNGAPGDGGNSLSTAMRKHLQSAGVKLVDQPSGANVWTVKGNVEMGSADGGQQPITIQWTVVDPSGKTLDKAVVQRNKVAQGSLDGPWGPIADLAAGEAARSIAKLIPKPTG